MDLYDTLQAEFPQIDTSLLAAIISDHAQGDDATHSSDQIDTIRDILKILANQAQEDEYEIDDIMSTTSLTTPDLCDSTTTTSESSSSQHLFSSPLGFLQEAFSDVPMERLKHLLREEYGGALEGDGDVDMERVVEYILNMEHIRDLEERGIDALEHTPSPLLNADWETVVHTKPKATPKLATPIKKKAKGRTIKIVDMMQTQHAPSQTKGIQKEGATMGAGVDIWTQVSSLSTHLATLLPPAPPSHFASFFHSPTHATPAHALRAALAALPSTSAGIKHKAKQKSPIKKPNQDAETNALLALLDLLRASPTYATLDAEQRNTLCADARVALSAAQNRPDDALDIVWILRDLEHPACLAGIYHLPPPVLDSNSNFTPARAKLPTGPPPMQLPPTSKRKFASSPSSPTTQPQPPELWQDVPIRSPRTTQPPENPNPMNKRKLRGAGNGVGKGKGGKEDIGELPGNGTGGNVSGARYAHFARGILQARAQRGELLREAGRAWRGPLGGEVALYYAQRAREVTEKAREDALDEARRLVEAKRYASSDKRSIDLHGTCVQEAIVITCEILEREGCSPVAGHFAERNYASSPLRLITGRGTHSAGGVGVLKPAVHRALVNKGWDVKMWDGGLVVRGRERWRVP
ncbi:hypothetical protein BDR04DRAFT_1144187 [Suillus decipiens]|nr:hypothetical protein BDR04DRAFT_1144187 [Suillus decipiens]